MKEAATLNGGRQRGHGVDQNIREEALSAAWPGEAHGVLPTCVLTEQRHTGDTDPRNGSTPQDWMRSPRWASHSHHLLLIQPPPHSPHGTWWCSGRDA